MIGWKKGRRRVWPENSESPVDDGEERRERNPLFQNLSFCLFILH